MVPAVEQQEVNNDRFRRNARQLQNCFRPLGRVERGRTVDGGRRRCRKSYVQFVFHNQARRQGVPGPLPVTSSHSTHGCETSSNPPIDAERARPPQLATSLLLKTGGRIQLPA